MINAYFFAVMKKHAVGLKKSVNSPAEMMYFQPYIKSRVFQ